MNNEGRNALHLEDLAMLASIERGNVWLRAVLSTLARRGLAMRNANPERARQILEKLAPLPLYKSGQFLFDLMEWEDFMLDGPFPDIIPTVLDPRSLTQLAILLNNIQQHLDGAIQQSKPPLFTANIDMSHLNTQPEELPELESSIYLYEAVVLGVWQAVVPTVS